MSEQERFRIVVVKGSVRPGNYTGMAVDLVADELRKMEGISIEVIDPIGMDLKLPGTGNSGSAERLQASRWGFWAWRPDRSARLKPWSICAASLRM
jgi:hypothetical protein